MRLALALIVLIVLPAQTMIPPCYLDQAVAEAVTVIQVADHSVRREEGRNSCTLTGTVVRSFRGDLAPGTPIQTTFACIDSERPEINAEVSVGGPIYRDLNRIAEAAVVEIHGAAEGGPAGDGWGLLTLHAPTDGPAFPFEHLPPRAEAAEARLGAPLTAP